ncbi:secreted RxLR effector protein 161-like [Vicia villosa]|uniref:secreted RxLR effector protein 161-like n=1 Tax=Vicia villosa TaxID=3911 RepID=UPI00273B9004|nr:secreted RxLR effector protein 161-like [Vicia villosa]
MKRHGGVCGRRQRQKSTENEFEKFGKNDSPNATSKYQFDPSDAHWVAVKNILKYLIRTKDSFLIYGGQEEFVVIGYTDASFQIDKDDFRSQSGYIFCLNGGAMSLKSLKHDTVIDSTTEVECIVALNATKEVVWIKKFIMYLA